MSHDDSPIEENNPPRMQTDNLGRSGAYTQTGVIAGQYEEVEDDGTPLPKKDPLDASEDLDGLLPIK